MVIKGELNGVYEKTNQTSYNKPVYKTPYTEMYLYYYYTTWYMGNTIGTYKAQNLVNEQYLPHNEQMYIYTHILNSFNEDINNFAITIGYYHGTTWYMGASIGTFKAKNLVNEQYLPYNKQMYIYTYILNSFYDDMNKFAGQCGLR